MPEIGGRPIEIAVFAVILGFAIGGVAVTIVYYLLM
jgi:hypothetical protein